MLSVLPVPRALLLFGFKRRKSALVLFLCRIFSVPFHHTPPGAFPPISADSGAVAAATAGADAVIAV